MTGEPRPLSEVMGEDHRELDRSWERVVATPSTDLPTRKERFARFRSGLLAHIEEEEAYLFPKFDPTDPALQNLVSRLLEEHREIRGILDRIDHGLSTGRSEIESLGFDLINLLGEHNAREESFAYPWLDDHLPPDQVLEARRRLGSHDTG